MRHARRRKNRIPRRHIHDGTAFLLHTPPALLNNKNLAAGMRVPVGARTRLEAHSSILHVRMIQSLYRTRGGIFMAAGLGSTRVHGARNEESAA
jgi:hypothetical protein